jgi:[ribosomal protein S5]-alanine N-acetyltransferase
MVILRHFELADAQRIALLLNNKNVWDNLRDYIPYPYSENDAVEYINFCNSQKPPTYFAIEYNGECVGSIGLILQHDVYRKSAEIGYWIGEPYWGKGIVSKAVELVVAYGFNELDIVRIYTGIFEFNIASQKVLAKNGFLNEGVFRKSIYKNGKLCDEIRFAIVKE